MNLAIDFGGTNIKAGIFEQGKLTEFFAVPADSDHGMMAALNRIGALAQQRGVKPGVLSRVGIATPGIVDSGHKRIVSINEKYADAVGFPFEAWCLEHYQCPLIMENDANAALLGEVKCGCGEGAENAVLMTIGTGIGTAAMIEGKLLRGCHGQAGILAGHFIVDIDGKPCSCRGRGCLETLAGSREIEKWVPVLDGFAASSLAAADRTGMKEIVEGMRLGDQFCSEIFQKIMDIYAVGLINLIHAYDPELAILSGGVLQSGDVILPELEHRIRERAWTPWGQVAVRLAVNPNQSVLLGLNAQMEENLR